MALPKSIHRSKEGAGLQGRSRTFQSEPSHTRETSLHGGAKSRYAGTARLSGTSWPVSERSE